MTKKNIEGAIIKNDRDLHIELHMNIHTNEKQKK